MNDVASGLRVLRVLSLSGERVRTQPADLDVAERRVLERRPRHEALGLLAIQPFQNRRIVGFVPAEASPPPVEQESRHSDPRRPRSADCSPPPRRPPPPCGAAARPAAAAVAAPAAAAPLGAAFAAARRSRR